MLDYLAAIWQGNPVRVTAIVAGVIVAVLAKAGIIIDQSTVIEALALALPVVLGGEVARSKVTPYVGDAAVSSDALLAEAIAADAKES